MTKLVDEKQNDFRGTLSAWQDNFFAGGCVLETLVLIESFNSMKKLRMLLFLFNILFLRNTTVKYSAITNKTQNI